MHGDLAAAKPKQPTALQHYSITKERKMAQHCFTYNVGTFLWFFFLASFGWVQADN